MRLSPQVKGYCRCAAGYWLEVIKCDRYAAVEVGGRHRPKLRYACMGFSEVSPLCGFFFAAVPQGYCRCGGELVRLKPQVIGYGLEVMDQDVISMRLPSGSATTLS